jgi:GT2 family glycosyltransferase
MQTNHAVSRYAQWVAHYESLTLTPFDTDFVAQRPVVISVVMPVYNTAEEYLRAAIDSVLAQNYPHWELCIADDASTAEHVRPTLAAYAAADARIKVVYGEKNGHISAASNAALAVATGDFVALLDHDDVLPPYALYEVAQAIAANPTKSMIYSDEDKITAEGVRLDPYFKSDWNPDLFLSHNMFSHLGVYKKSLMDAVGGFRVGLEGSQDYDLALRCLTKVGHQAVHHIPHVLYHWRIIPGSTAMNPDEKPYALIAAQKAIGDSLVAKSIQAEVTTIAQMGMLRVRYALPAILPKVSMIIPTRNAQGLVQQCIQSVLAKTLYKNYEILLVDNGSDDAEALAYFKSLADAGTVTLIRDDGVFNYSRINNHAARLATGDILCLLNNDIEVISPDWLGEMVSHALRPEIGAVGAKLWYPNDTIQHAGVGLGLGSDGVAGHLNHLLPKSNNGYFGKASLIQNLSAVTAACLVVRKAVFDQVGGLNEIDLAVAFNDVDLCIRIRDAGYRNLYTPYAELYHHESASRGSDHDSAIHERFQKECDYMKNTYGAALQNDPYYSPNLSLVPGLQFEVSMPPRASVLNLQSLSVRYETLLSQLTQLQQNPLAQGYQPVALSLVAPPTLKQSIKMTIKALGRSIQFRLPALASFLKPIYTALLRLYRL